MRTLVFIGLLMASFAPGFALADGDEPLLPSDGRIKLLMYDESDVYTITTRYGYQTNIVFGPQEEIDTISVGDRSMWQIIPSGNRIFIRPMEENVTTNMTVITNKHSYQFDLKSIAAAAKGGNIYVAKFIYDSIMPKDQYASDALSAGHVLTPPVSAVQQTSAPAFTSQTVPVDAYKPYQPEQPTNLNPSNANYNYTYVGPDELAPMQVYDDGRYTFIKYRNTDQPFPNAYLALGGQEKPLPYSIQNGAMVIDGVAKEILLKSSAGNVRIYNETLNPG